MTGQRPQVLTNQAEWRRIVSDFALGIFVFLLQYLSSVALCADSLYYDFPHQHHHPILNLTLSQLTLNSQHIQPYLQIIGLLFSISNMKLLIRPSQSFQHQPQTSLMHTSSAPASLLCPGNDKCSPKHIQAHKHMHIKHFSN